MAVGKTNFGDGRVGGGAAYTAPPIVEAVIEIRFADQLNNTTLERLASRMTKRYDVMTTEQLFDVQIAFPTGEPSVSNRRPVHRFASNDQTDICVVKPDALAWSRLAPYTGWSAFVERLRSDLEVAVKIAGWRRITRVGIRYMNRIDVPIEADQSEVRYENYLAITLNLPKRFDPINGYLWRIEKRLPESDILVIINSGTMQPEILGTGAFLLDIDVVLDHDLPSNLDRALEVLETMRDVKNEMFEMSITQLARESFV